MSDHFITTKLKSASGLLSEEPPGVLLPDPGIASAIFWSLYKGLFWTLFILLVFRVLLLGLLLLQRVQ